MFKFWFRGFQAAFVISTGHGLKSNELGLISIYSILAHPADELTPWRAFTDPAETKTGKREENIPQKTTDNGNLP